MKIVHLTSAHPRHDIRIFIKECASLAKAGHNVHLIVADGQGSESKLDVTIHDAGRNQGSRFTRMTGIVNKVARIAQTLNPDILHFHDPELIYAALKLKKSTGAQIIYDVHEDVPRQILAKHWIPSLLRPTISQLFEWIENRAAQQFEAIITSTPHIRQRFSSLNHYAIDICNYPILTEFLYTTPWEEKRNEVCYVGGISRIRGIEPIVNALPQAGIRLNLAGRWSETDLRVKLMQSPGWSWVNELGILDRQNVIQILNRSKVGLVTLFPTPNYVDALPIKLFEYMAAGIPVIASDFPVWRKIIEDAKCGLLVDPQNPQAIASAICYLFNHPHKAKKMGQSGQIIVQQRYSWESESQKLLRLYKDLGKNKYGNNIKIAQIDI